MVSVCHLNVNSMKNLLLILLISVLTQCNTRIIEKPENLIEEDKMIEIIYDLALLDAVKSQNPIYLETNKINPRTYVYKKYSIDSLQFVKSNQYYASDVEAYKKIYDKVSQRIENLKDKTDKSAPVDPDAPQIQ